MTELFSTRADAASHLDGTLDWEWDGDASWDGWVTYAYLRQDGSDQALAAYLTSVGQNPADYSV